MNWEQIRPRGCEFVDTRPSQLIAEETKAEQLWFQLPFKHFSAPGIQLKMAIIFFTKEATSPLFSPGTAAPVSSGLDPSYPAVSQLTQIRNIPNKSPIKWEKWQGKKFLLAFPSHISPPIQRSRAALWSSVGIFLQYYFIIRCNMCLQMLQISHVSYPVYFQSLIIEWCNNSVIIKPEWNLW